MPSPFPGMDPYLEGPTWMSFHSQFTAEIARQLAPRIRPKYLAFTTEWFIEEFPESMAAPTTESYPDVGVVESGRGGTMVRSVATSAPMQLHTVMPTGILHFAVEIRDRIERRLVTAIVVMSPTNKRGLGRANYLAKRFRLLHGSVNLLEIDLLRQGQRVPMQEKLPPAPYFVFLSRASKQPLTDVWPISLREPLPKVQVPLLQDDPDVALDLQTAFAAIYDLLGYDLTYDYTKPPPTPLSGEDAVWADQLVRAAGLRS